MFTLWERLLVRVNLWTARKLDRIFEWSGEDLDWDDCDWDDCEDCG